MLSRDIEENITNQEKLFVLFRMTIQNELSMVRNGRRSSWWAAVRLGHMIDKMEEVDNIILHSLKSIGW